jgi:hypothetical protein
MATGKQIAYKLPQPGSIRQPALTPRHNSLRAQPLRSQTAWTPACLSRDQRLAQRSSPVRAKELASCPRPTPSPSTKSPRQMASFGVLNRFAIGLFGFSIGSCTNPWDGDFSASLWEMILSFTTAASAGQSPTTPGIGAAAHWPLVLTDRPAHETQGTAVTELSRRVRNYRARL